MPIIEVDYEYTLPNNYLVDHSQSEGKTRQTTYDGPDKIYLIVNNETGKEEMGPIIAEEKADGRPLPLNCRYVEVDCIENPLVCQLKAPVVDEAEEDYTGIQVHPQCVPVEGYPTYTYQTPVLPKDIYDRLDLTVDSDDNITLHTKSVVEAAFGGAFSELPDWETVKKERNHRLQASDAQFNDDMPEELKEKWKLYRQRLRDLPSALSGSPAWVALNMFPYDPNTTPPDEE